MRSGPELVPTWNHEKILQGRAVSERDSMWGKHLGPGRTLDQDDSGSGGEMLWPAAGAGRDGTLRLGEEDLLAREEDWAAREGALGTWKKEWRTNQSGTGAWD